MTRAYVALGANLGDAQATVRWALAQLGVQQQCRLLASSSLYRSAPVDATGPDFVNAVAVLETSLSAHQLLHILQALEQAAGRVRSYRNAPRTLDLDLLLYGSSQLNTPELQVPHPRMMERAFVLRPLAELAPDLVPPAALMAVANQPIKRL
jgi:2-amino-4-hydroxy-6-hydroxymethyldihydropteridine diphosphokinase